jgi:large subunit ribosomal protein L15
MGRTKKMRGKRTHGRGRKAGRGAGMRGGRGQAGLHKHKFKKMIKEDPDHFGSRGFTRHAATRPPERTLNLRELEVVLPQLAEAGHAKKKGKGFEVDLTEAGYSKLLGRGQVRTALWIRVGAASTRAKERVSNAGGEILITDEEE